MTDEEYNKALVRINEIFFTKNEQEIEELERLVSEVEDYEKQFIK